MVGVAENNLCLDILLQFSKVYTFYATQRTYGHEYRSFYLSVVSSDETCTGITFRVGMLELKCQHVFSYWLWGYPV